MEKIRRVAVVILSWNGRSFLEQFLPFVCQSTWPNLELVVADNNSSDDTVAFMRSKYPKITLIELKENTGFAGGYNNALARVNADYYVLLNQDVEVSPGWIEPVIEMMEADSMIAAAQPKMRSFHEKHLFEYAGAAGGFIDNFAYPFCRGRLFDQLEEDQGQYESSIPIFWASGAAMFIRAKLFHQAGAFDADFFAHMEEIDLCWRLHNAGYSVYYCPDSVVYHVGGGSLPQGNPRKTKLNFRNNLRMMFKNMDTPELLWKLPVRFGLDLLAAVIELLKAKPANALAIVRAGFGFILSIPYWWKRRKHYKQLIAQVPRGTVSENEGKYMKSVIWQYFIRKRHLFSELPDRWDN